ncbi:MAG: EAL domain-containing protein [Methylacidiphilales bacterium]|nr:EAL domain-containing protein [Candidatus Methylacidiphilales bacterium]
MREPDARRRHPCRAARLGVRTALTDFGCGPLSLDALAGLPLDEVKLARSLFATPAGSAPQEAVIWRVAEAAILLARHFRIMLVADGVDDALTQRRLVEAGCAWCRVACSRSRLMRRHWPPGSRPSMRAAAPVGMMDPRHPRWPLPTGRARAGPVLPGRDEPAGGSDSRHPTVGTRHLAPDTMPPTVLSHSASQRMAKARRQSD